MGTSSIVQCTRPLWHASRQGMPEKDPSIAARILLNSLGAAQAVREHTFLRDKCHVRLTLLKRQENLVDTAASFGGQESSGSGCPKAVVEIELSGRSTTPETVKGACRSRFCWVSQPQSRARLSLLSGESLQESRRRTTIMIMMIMESWGDAIATMNH